MLSTIPSMITSPRSARGANAGKSGRLGCKTHRRGQSSNQSLQRVRGLLVRVSLTLTHHPRKSHRLEMRLSSLPLRVRTYARLRPLLPKPQSSSSRSNLSSNLSHGNLLVSLQNRGRSMGLCNPTLALPRRAKNTGLCSHRPASRPAQRLVA